MENKMKVKIKKIYNYTFEKNRLIILYISVILLFISSFFIFYDKQYTINNNNILSTKEMDNIIGGCGTLVKCQKDDWEECDDPDCEPKNDYYYCDYLQLVEPCRKQGWLTTICICDLYYQKQNRNCY